MRQQTIKYICEVITPLFLGGAQGDIPEIRPPSIKGSLRFWFRALHGHISDIDELQHYEGFLFGNTNRRSQIILRTSCPDRLKIDEFPLLPHQEDIKGNRHKASYKRAIAPQQQFSVSLTGPSGLLPKACTLFELSLFLGGWGKRSRRGAGSIEIVSKEGAGQTTSANSLNDLDGLLKIISVWTPHFVRSGDKIQFNFSGRKANYPWLRRIEIGSNGHDNYRSLLTHIGIVTSKLKRRNIRAYEATMGHAFRGRFASPAYTTIIREGSKFFPVISFLNIEPGRDEKNIDLEIQEQYRDQILNF